VATAPTEMAATAVETTLEALHLLTRHGGLIECRILQTPRGTLSGYFDQGHLDTLARDAQAWDGRVSVYITANPVQPELIARASNRLRGPARETTADREIVRRAWFLTDFDPQRPRGISATDAEVACALTRRDEAVAFLGELGFPEPVLAMSGNGGHALWPVDLPNDEATATLISQCLKALGARFSDYLVTCDQAVFNAARIWKLYGTLAVKGDPVPDRPHRRAELERVPSPIVQVTREQLEMLAAAAPAERIYSPPPTGRTHVREELNVAEAFRVRGWYRRPLRDGKHAVVCPWQAEHSGDSGVTETVIFEPGSPGEPWGFDCKHAHCTARTIRDVYALLRQAVNGHAAGDHVEVAPGVLSEVSPGPLQGFVFRPIGELLAQPDTGLEWLVEGLLPREAISLLVGRPKSGKTTLCRTLAADVAGGSAFLARRTEQGPVIYVSLEDSKRAVTAHFRRLGVSPDAPLYVVCAQAPPDALQLLRREVERRRPALVAIDTLYRFTKVGSVDAYAEVNAALQPLLGLQRELRFHLLLIHHSPKGADATRDAIDAGLGSTALPGTVDLALFLRCFPDGRRTLCSSPRAECGDPLPETVVALNQETGRPVLGSTRQEADESEAAGAILDYLTSQTAAVEEPIIHDAVEGRRAVKVRALRQLVKDEKVTRTGEGRRGTPFLYAVSSSLVPTYIREQGNQKPKGEPSTEEERLDSGSAPNAGFVSGSRAVSGPPRPATASDDEVVL
jgi:AAA domain-containing protein